MMKQHLTPEAVTRLQRKESSPHEILGVLRHLSGCPECRALARLDDDAEKVRTIFIGALAEPSPHLKVDEELFAYVDGLLGPAERELIESHIEDCESCRVEVEELVMLRGAPKPKRLLSLGLAASVLVPLVAAAILWRSFTPTRGRFPIQNSRPPVPSMTVTPTTYDNQQWTVLVAVALKQGRLPTSPKLSLVRGSYGTVRGDTKTTRSTLAPSGTAIDSTYPRFIWPASENAAYMVTVADDSEVLVTSKPLRRAEWVCDHSLSRDRSYVWQVEVMFPDGRTEILPAPPEPEARFHVISDREHQELVVANTRYPNDHLLLAVLYARSGMQTEAEKELRLLAAQEPSSEAVRRLLSNTPASP